VTSTYTVSPVDQPLDGRIRPPGSKSLTNRALVCAALADGPSEITGALASEDTLVMLAALRQLGLQITSTPDNTVINVAGLPSSPALGPLSLDIRNSGTTIRFLASFLSTLGGDYRLDGTKRMRERPMGDLINAIQQLGGSIYSLGDNQCPPLHVSGTGWNGGQATVAGDISSQFLSGLLLAAPRSHSDVTLKLSTPLVSKPYVEMTTAVMSAFGVQVSSPKPDTYHVPAGDSYRGTKYEIEPDASAASYFWAAAAIAGGSVAVEGLSLRALQGDVRFVECLKAMGCQVTEDDACIRVTAGPLQGIDVDMNAISDTVQTLAVVALFATGSTHIRNVAHIRHKESDRIGDLARELRKLGASVDEHDDGLTIHPGPLQATTLDTYEDHRMAMSLALAGLKQPGVVINDPGCTSKTYPHFFTDLESLIDQP